MSHRADDIRKRIARRRKHYGGPKKARLTSYHSYEPSEYDDHFTDLHEQGSFHPLWNKELFLLKIFSSAILLLIIAIMFQSPSSAFEKARSVVKKTMETEYQFAAAADWYEKKFGKPLALMPGKSVGTVDNQTEKPNYAAPVSGKILEEFSGDGRGIMLETGTGAEVEAMTGGVVLFAGKKEDIGNTVIIQHPDQSESWYGKLDVILVKPLEKVNSGKIVGTVSNREDNTAGEFYFAIKQGTEFIDPIQVMKFE